MPAESAAMSSEASQGLYIYAVVPATAVIDRELAGLGEPAAPVRLVVYEDVAAVVSELVIARPLGKRADLRAHEQVVETLHENTNLLPVRFGTVLADDEAIRDELLAAHHDVFAERLVELAGHAQWTLRGDYVESAILQEILSEQPEARQLKAEVAEVSEQAGYYLRIRLGEIIAAAMQSKRATDQQQVLDRLGEYTVSVIDRKASGTEQALDLAFLVADDMRAAFEQAVEAVGRDWAGRMTLRLLGPRAPYDFADTPLSG